MTPRERAANRKVRLQLCATPFERKFVQAIAKLPATKVIEYAQRMAIGELPEGISTRDAMGARLFDLTKLELFDRGYRQVTRWVKEDA